MIQKPNKSEPKKYSMLKVNHCPIPTTNDMVSIRFNNCYSTIYVIIDCGYQSPNPNNVIREITQYHFYPLAYPTSHPNRHILTLLNYAQNTSVPVRGLDSLRHGVKHFRFE